jgi:hypothetical protein
MKVCFHLGSELVTHFKEQDWDRRYCFLVYTTNPSKIPPLHELYKSDSKSKMVLCR